MNIVSILVLLVGLTKCVGLMAIGGTGELSVEVNAGSTRPWPRHVIDDTSRGADGVKLTDFNGDGWIDIVTGWEEGGEVHLCLHPGAEKVRGTWDRVLIGKVQDPEDAVPVDLDGDGCFEAVSSTEGETRTVYVHRFQSSVGRWLLQDAWSTVPFPVTQKAQSWMQAVAHDLDGRYGIDIVLGAKGRGAKVGWLQSPADPWEFDAWTYWPLRDAGWVMSILTQDMDQDGDVDLILTDRKGERSGVFWLENPGANKNSDHADWSEHAIGALGREVMFGDVGDLNADRKADVVVAVKPVEIAVYLWLPDGLWRERVLNLKSPLLGDAKAVKIADLNGDGWPDLLFSCENADGPREGIVWLERQRNGPWLRHSIGGPEGRKFDLIEVNDLDGDGDPDVITCEESDGLGVVWYENVQP